MIQDRYYDELNASYEKVEYTSNHYRLVKKAVQENDVKFLVNSFSAFIMRYAILIHTGEVLRSRYVTSSGIVRYKTPSTLWKFLQFYSDVPIKNNKQAFKKACEKVQYIYHKYEFGDIYNETVLTFIDVVNTFRTRDDLKNGSFSKFIKNQFHFYINNTLRRKLMRDPIMLADLGYVPEGSYVHDFSYLDKEIALKYSDTLIARNDGDIGFNWISGVTCDDIFKCLTRYERELIYNVYVQNKTIKQVAKELSVSYWKLSKKVTLVTEKLRQECLKQHLIKE